MGERKKNYLSGPNMGFCIISIKLRKEKEEILIIVMDFSKHSYK